MIKLAFKGLLQILRNNIVQHKARELKFIVETGAVLIQSGTSEILRAPTRRRFPYWAEASSDKTRPPKIKLRHRPETPAILLAQIRQIDMLDLLLELSVQEIVIVGKAKRLRWRPSGCVNRDLKKQGE